MSLIVEPLFWHMLQKHQLLISGGRKGYTCVFDLRHLTTEATLPEYDSPVKAIKLLILLKSTLLQDLPKAT